MMRKKLGILGLFVMIGLVGVVLAATGLSSDYHRGAPLKVAPGFSVDVVFGRLQNTGDSDIVYEVELIEGGSIATLTDANLDNFVVPAGSTNTPINVKISIPENVAEGTEYEVIIRYKDITPTEGDGMVTITGSSQSVLPVLVSVEQPEKPIGEGMNWWWIIIIVVLIIVVWIVFRMMKKSSV